MPQWDGGHCRSYRMRRLIILLLLALATTSRATDMARPWTFWYWMYGNVSQEGIRADLQAMKDAGLGGCYLMPIRGAAETPSSLPQRGEADALSSNFWKMVDCALAQADSLGLGVGIHICDGFALAGGPWISPEESMQKIVFADTVLTGGFRHLRMPKPAHYESYYEDIAVYAVPIGQEPEAASPKLTYSPKVTLNAKGVLCADEPCWIQYVFDEPTLVRHIEIEPSGNNIQSQRLLVKASDDGVLFHEVKALAPPRQGWQNTGFNTTFSIPPTKARFFRFEWTPEGTEPGAEDLDAAKWKPVLRLKSIKLGSWPLLDNWEGKAGYVWRIAPETPATDLSAKDFLRPTDLVCAQMDGDMLEIDLPKGLWRILRIGHTSTGHTNATAGGARGLECDKFSREAVAKQVDRWFGLFMNRPNRKAIEYLHVDSWECGSQNWSKNFAQEFERRRGYDILPLLPVYAGVPMVGGEEALRDIRKTIDELVNEVFFATVAQKAKDYGVRLSAESVAPTMVSDGMTHYKYVDFPMGEYWLNSPTHDKPNDMLDAISGAHVYGKPIVQAEGFTEVRGVWDETPASIKTLLDRNLALGMNRLFFHVFTHNPWTDLRPGMTLDGIGLFFQRDQTWFPEARALTDYVTRCQRLLQRGRPVTDIAVFTGEEYPRRALTPDRLVPMLPGLFGAERVASEQQRLANHGQPMTESPVGVRHSAGILDLKDWINPLHGYHYDSMNPDALLTQPFNYKVLVVPEGCRVSPEVSARIDQLRANGVAVIDRPYTQAHFDHLPPDAVLPQGVAFCHRRDAATDIYFLSNQLDTVQTFTAAFRCNDGDVTVYDPMTDRCTTPVDDILRHDSLTVVRLTMQPRQALFVLIGDDSMKSEVVSKWSSPLEPNQPRRQMTWQTKGGWRMSFAENGVQMKTDTLFSWADHRDDAVRYYSGHVRYSTTLMYKAKNMDGRVVLALGDVRDVAHVWLNGHDLGIVWMPPYEVDATDHLLQGKNTLEVEVVNTWHNALRGADRGTPPYPGIWTNATYRTKGDALLPAGLLGPVELRTKD